MNIPCHFHAMSINDLGLNVCDRITLFNHVLETIKSSSEEIKCIKLIERQEGVECFNYDCRALGRTVSIFDKANLGKTYIIIIIIIFTFTLIIIIIIISIITRDLYTLPVPVLTQHECPCLELIFLNQIYNLFL